MQSPVAGDHVVVSFYIKDPDSSGDKMCETFYATNRDSWVVQGKRCGVKVAAQLVALGDDETFCELSDRTVDHFVRTYVKEHYGVDLDGAMVGPDRQRP